VIHNSVQFSCFSHVIRRESDWNPRARNPSSGAYGIPQALPARKLATAGSDWRTNPRTQIRWAIRYMHQSYGSPCRAWRFWRHHHWY
jgi:transglycosylase-like protein with SLT domain